MERAKTSVTELLVITHEDARFALNGELQAKRPKENALRRIHTATAKVQEAIAVIRARRRLYPKMRHPRYLHGAPRLLTWPNWHELFRADKDAESALAPVRQLPPVLEWDEQSVRLEDGSGASQETVESPQPEMHKAYSEAAAAATEADGPPRGSVVAAAVGAVQFGNSEAQPEDSGFSASFDSPFGGSFDGSSFDAGGGSSDGFATGFAAGGFAVGVLPNDSEGGGNARAVSGGGSSDAVSVQAERLAELAFADDDVRCPSQSNTHTPHQTVAALLGLQLRNSPKQPSITLYHLLSPSITLPPCC